MNLAIFFPLYVHGYKYSADDGTGDGRGGEGSG